MKIHLRHRPRHGHHRSVACRGCAAALEALRFRLIAEGSRSIARGGRPAAARDATTAGIHPPGGSAWGPPVRVLSGEDEARTPPKALSPAFPRRWIGG
jgi:hypothetical protein